MIDKHPDYFSEEGTGTSLARDSQKLPSQL